MSPPEAIYTDRHQRFADRARDLERRSRRLSNARLAAFLLALAAFLAPVFTSRPNLLWTAATAAFLAVFAVLVVLHGHVDARRRRAEERRRINAEALRRLARDWEHLPEPRVVLEQTPSFARDLDLFGHASLWKLVGTASTPLGRSTLARWLVEPALPEEVRSRQGAVRELARCLDFRQELQLRTRALADLDCQAFLGWAEDEPWLARRPALTWAARLLPLAVLALLGLAAGGVVPHHLWILVFIANLTLAMIAGKSVAAIFSRISSREGEFREYSRALELVAACGKSQTATRTDSFRHPRLVELRERLAGDRGDARRQMGRLHRRVALSDVRYGMVHGLLQGLFLWDFHVLGRLEKWQLEAGPAARRWLAALGEVEALAGLAGLAFDHPEWCFPELVDPAPGKACLEARGLGHPLLGAARVANDVEVGPAGTFLLVTGSNMSGKSTLIRALGVNAVLAQAGGPVCAAALSLPPVELGTSVLIEDSLEDGVSYFMAELQRVKEIVDLAGASRRRGRTLLYLLDEILRGTNSVERQEAVRRVLAHLLAEGAIGAVATHDLMLAEIDELAAACRPVHFRETLDSGPDERPVMSFDYRLRPGVATTRNALKLLELVGLDHPAGL